MIKYFNKSDLILANKIAKKRGYNRQLIDKISDLDDLNFPIIFNMIHEHAAGVKVDPHMRCVVSISPHTVVQIDCDLDLYESLPFIEG
jgi:hypothetical protein